jgi:hypothetical protein
MFAESTEWKMPWLPRKLPNIAALATSIRKTVHALRPGGPARGMAGINERWSTMTIDELDLK